MKTRREVLNGLAAAAVSLGVARLAPASEPAVQTGAAPPSGPFALPPLPYGFDALEPHIDAQTMQIHHDRHHAAYVNNLNKAVANHPDLKSKPVEQLISDISALPEAIRDAVINHGGGHANHSLFWLLMSGKGGGQPKGELAKAIEARFGGYEKFLEQFDQAATGQFGSGWAWLSLNEQKQLSIESTANQNSPLMVGRTPLLGIDVWEHAYYLKYQNRRPDYVKAWHNVINWDYVADRYDKLRKG